MFTLRQATPQIGPRAPRLHTGEALVLFEGMVGLLVWDMMWERANFRCSEEEVSRCEIVVLRLIRLQDGRE